MTENDKLQMFEDQMIRTAWDETKEEWYFSIVDVVKALTEQSTPRGASNYWAKLKERLKSEGASELLTNCQQLKLKAADGKRRLTDKAKTFDAGVCGGKYLLQYQYGVLDRPPKGRRKNKKRKIEKIVKVPP